MRLSGFGQTIESDIAIAGTLAADEDDNVQVLTIRSMPPRHSEAKLLYRRDGEALIFAAPDVAEYRCLKNGIEITPDPDADSEHVTDLLIATALPAALWMQGRFMLHASCIMLPGADKAIAIAGPSGFGKSTIAGALLNYGASLVGDDSIAVTANDDDISACGLPGGVFLQREGQEAREFSPIAAERALTRASLAGIFVLRGRSETGSLNKLDPATAAMQLLAMQHRPRIPAILGRMEEMLDIAAGIAKNLPIYDWQRREGALALEPFELEILTQVGLGG